MAVDSPGDPIIAGIAAMIQREWCFDAIVRQFRQIKNFEGQSGEACSCGSILDQQGELSGEMPALRPFDRAQRLRSGLSVCGLARPVRPESTGSRSSTGHKSQPFDGPIPEPWPHGREQRDHPAG